MNKSESIKELAGALAKAQGELINPANTESVRVRTRDGRSYSFKYAPLYEVLSIVRPTLAKHGLSILQTPYTEHEGRTVVHVVTTLLHESGEWMEFPTMSLEPPQAGAQALGSIITYLRRYALSAILGIASEEDDDGNMADGNTADGNTTERNQPKPRTQQNRPNVVKVSTTISTEQAKKFFEIAEGDNELVREVLTTLNYKSSTAVPKKEYENVCKFILEAVNVKKEEKKDEQASGTNK